MPPPNTDPRVQWDDEPLDDRVEWDVEPEAEPALISEDGTGYVGEVQQLEPMDVQGERAPEHSDWTAAGAGIADAMTLGHTDELAGAVHAATPRGAGERMAAGTRQAAAGAESGDIGAALRGLFGAGVEAASLNPIAAAIDAVRGGDRYEQGRDRMREGIATAREANPTDYLAGNVAGGLALGQLLPSAAAAAGPSAMSRIGASAGQGALEGLVAGEGFSDAQDAGGILEDAVTGGLTGGVVGGAIQGGGEAIGAGLRRATSGMDADALAEAGADRRLRALFGTDRPPRRAFREMFGTRGDRASQVRQTLADLDDLGVSRAEQAPALQRQAGQQMAEAVEGIDDAAARHASQAGPRGNANASTVDAAGVAQRIRDRSQQLRTERGISDDVAAVFEREAQRWDAAAGEPMTMQRAWQFRQEMADPAYWTIGPRGELPRSASSKRELYDIIRQSMNEGADRVAPEQAAQFREGARQYSLLSPLSEAADEAAFRAAQNREVGLTDTLGMLAGSNRGGIIGSALGGVANRMVRAHEKRIAATAYERLADIARRRPEILGRYGQAINSAAARSPAAFAATMFQLQSTNPDARQAMEGALEQEDDLLEGAEDDGL